ncbi:hypothetical protein CEXT_239181 [Caerostris extrusa]|uniref:Uncharacterized protein n=1 Tax=Caerostris extrusa TaxID=172846 RepID=A0AAV4S3Z8_CAEEX|nr:hypothetical protein CEXT_239181 [Caerostris extrusa]
MFESFEQRVVGRGRRLFSASRRNNIEANHGSLFHRNAQIKEDFISISLLFQKRRIRVSDVYNLNISTEGDGPFGSAQFNNVVCESQMDFFRGK